MLTRDAGLVLIKSWLGMENGGSMPFSTPQFRTHQEARPLQRGLP